MKMATAMATAAKKTTATNGARSGLRSARKQANRASGLSSWAQSESSDDDTTSLAPVVNAATPATLAPVQHQYDSISRDRNMPFWLSATDKVDEHGDELHSRAIPITVHDSFHHSKDGLGAVYTQPSIILGKSLSATAKMRGTCRNETAADGAEPWRTAYGASQPFREERVFIFSILEYAFACQVLPK